MFYDAQDLSCALFLYNKEFWWYKLIINKKNNPTYLLRDKPDCFSIDLITLRLRVLPGW